MAESLKKQLGHCFEQLDENNQKGLVLYAQFLLQQQVPKDIVIEKPEFVPGPENEKVVAAIKRLSAIYFMIDKKHVLDKSSQLMTEHMLNGRDAVSVINELEQLFDGEYQNYCLHKQQEIEKND